MRKSPIIIACCALLVLTIKQQSLAQLVQVPLRVGEMSNARTLSEGDTLQLPFWDDFSQAPTEVDSARWTSFDALVSFTKGINLPSLGTAVFDGVNRNGVPHNSANQFVSPADSLTSKPINLGDIAESQKSSVWLSFFYQLRGLAEIPEVQDSIRLQFYQQDSTWRTVWSITGGIDNVSDDFQQVLVPLDRQPYFHSGFRFRFQSFSRVTGPFDNFLIDYVYLDQGRNSSDNRYFDRSLSTLPSYVLNGFSAIPMEVFREFPQQLVRNPSVEVNNLDDQIQPIDFSAVIRNKLSGEALDTLNSETVVNPILEGLERREVSANAPDVGSWPLDEDSLFLESQFYITSGDRDDEGINFRVNDTITTPITLHNYLAYDDNTAEFAAGINQAQGLLAVQYFLPTEADLTHLDIYFPQIFPLSNGQPIQLYVWRDLGGEVGSILAKQQFSVNFTDSENAFTRYRFEFPVAVVDTFFVGFQQFTDNFIGIGLDKSYNNMEKIWADVSGVWEQNDRVDGTLMIRPVFVQQDDVITSLTEIKEEPVHLFPNPASSAFTVRAQHISAIEIFNLAGQSLARVHGNLQSEILIPVDQLQQGVYLVKVTTANGNYSRKLLIR